jgi:exonuclease VII small subunit
VSRVTGHIEGARVWLDRAARSWEAGRRARAVLDLQLAEAEVRLARQLAAREPAPHARRQPLALVVAVAAVVAAAVAGGLRWPAAIPPERAAAHAAGRAVSLGYVPGSLLALVAPPGDRLVGRPWAEPSVDEATLWVQAVLREAGIETEAVPASLR